MENRRPGTSKYAIDSELTKMRNQILPTDPAMAGMINAFMTQTLKNLGTQDLDYEKFTADGVRLHVFTPRSLKGKATPCLYYIHGGGFVYKESEAQYQNEQEYALRAGCRVIGIDYSLLPAHPYPEAQNECIRAYRFLLEHAADLQIDPTQIVLGGDSAGGLFALEVWLAAGQNSLQLPKGLMLIYPVVDNACETDSMQRFEDTPVWNARLNRDIWKRYLNGETYCPPLRRLEEFSVRNLFVEVEEFDCLHDEGKLFYEGLADGTDHAVLLENRGTFHGFDVNRKAAVTIRTMEARCGFLRRCFESR